MTDDIPQGWRKCKLGDVADIQNGYAFSSSVFKSDTGIPVIKIKNVASGNLRMDEVDYYQLLITENIERFVIKNGDILIAMTGSHINQPSSMVGKVARYDLNGIALLNQRVSKIFSLDKNILNEDFLYYFLKQEEITYELALNAGGSANQANISPKLIKALDFLLPPLPEQKAIASVLGSLDDKIDLLRKENQTLEQLAETLFRQWFIEEADDSWEEVPLGNSNLATIISSGINYFEGEKTYLATGDVDNTEVKGGTSITFKNRPSRANMEPVVNSVWFAKKGGVRKLLMFTDYSQNLHNLILSTGFTGLKTTALSHYYVWCYIMSPEFQEIRDSFVSGTVQPDINNDSLNQIMIPKPDDMTLLRFNEIVKPFFIKIYFNQVQIHTLENLRDTLLPKLMSGEVRVKLEV
jgi:type I restriction enzyme S subunit